MEIVEYLFITFKNAAFFRDSSRSKDFVFDLDGKKKRIECEHYVEPINVKHVANALHVLMGERPVPTLRKSNLKFVDEIYDIAKNGYIRIDTYTYKNKYQNIDVYPEEVTTIRKSVYNSYSTAPEVISWERVRRLLENDLNDQFISLINDLMGFDVKNNYPLCVDGVKALRDNHINDPRLINFIDVLRKNKKQPMIDFINGSQKPSKNQLMANPNATGAEPTFNSNPRTQITTNFGVDKKTKISGRVIIGVDQKHLQKVKNNKGYAKILEGGYFYIENNLPPYLMTDSMFDGFKKIGDISTETKKIKI